MHTLLRRIVSCVPALTGRRTSSPQTWGAGGAFLLALALLSPAPARAAGYTLTTLHTFSADRNGAGNVDGSYPETNVTLDGMGHLYGTAVNGGKGDSGTLFEEDLATKTFTTLVNFIDYNEGGASNSGVTLDGQGHLYGTTLKYDGGGTVFEYDLTSGVLTTLVTFTSNTDGHYPNGDVTLDGNGNLYDTTGGGGIGYGTVFKLNLATKGVTTLATFNGNNGSYPSDNVALDGNGNLYGTTNEGGGKGGNGYGTVFKVNIATKRLTTLVNFNGTNGATPYADVTLDGSGNLYGTTFEGGANGTGTVWELTPNP